MALSLKQEAFVSAYIGEASYNATEAARLAGYAHAAQQGSRLLTNVDISARIAAYRAKLEADGIASQTNRIRVKNERWLALQQVRAERAKDPTIQHVPGGTTGLIVRSLKVSPGSDPVEEYAIDTGLLAAENALEESVARELGQIDSGSSTTLNQKLYIGIQVERV